MPMVTTPVRPQRSLFGEILDWMLVPLLLLWPVSVALTWLVAQGLANRPYDAALADLARSVAHRVVANNPAATLSVGSASRLRVPDSALDVPQASDSEPVTVQVLGLRGELLQGDADLPVPQDERPGELGELRFRDDQLRGEPVRVAYLWLPEMGGGGSGPLVQVAETLDKRARLATEIVKGVILPQFVILPLGVLLVWMALARGLAPLNELQRRIRQREGHDLSPIAESGAPEEVAPLVGAINDLLARLDQSISAQKHFLADAAHQLKTPLAGLRTQAELAQREIDAGRQDPQALKRSLQQIARSSQRAAHTVNQLLALARAEDKEQALRRQEIPLAKLAIETVRDFVPRALDKQIDLGYEGPDHDTADTRLTGQTVLVRELIRNLVDNALQYTPSGGTVTVRVLPDPFGQVVVLQVEDSGPGVAPHERELVFQPFFRSVDTEQTDGSGLGLAIVREIAQQHRAEVMLDDAIPRGARFTVRFPLKSA
jgi:two-component system sensor histidine kinase TctE